jgi:hypothetical protein
MHLHVKNIMFLQAHGNSNRCQQQLLWYANGTVCQLVWFMFCW